MCKSLFFLFCHQAWVICSISHFHSLCCTRGTLILKTVCDFLHECRLKYGTMHKIIWTAMVTFQFHWKPNSYNVLIIIFMYCRILFYFVIIVYHLNDNLYCSAEILLIFFYVKFTPCVILLIFLCTHHNVPTGLKQTFIFRFMVMRHQFFKVF